MTKPDRRPPSAGDRAPSAFSPEPAYQQGTPGLAERGRRASSGATAGAVATTVAPVVDRGTENQAPPTTTGRRHNPTVIA